MVSPSLEISRTHLDAFPHNLLWGTCCSRGLEPMMPLPTPTVLSFSVRKSHPGVGMQDGVFSDWCHWFLRCCGDQNSCAMFGFMFAILHESCDKSQAEILCLNFQISISSIKSCLTSFFFSFFPLKDIFFEHWPNTNHLQVLWNYLCCLPSSVLMFSRILLGKHIWIVASVRCTPTWYCAVKYHENFLK